MQQVADHAGATPATAYAGEPCDTSDMARHLASGISALRLAVDATISGKLLDYARLITDWDRVHRVAAVRDGDRSIALHVLDCLAVLPHLSPGTIADVGSGAGLPGIPLALARPGVRVTLIETHHRKAQFLRTAAAELGLANVKVVNERVETLSGQQTFDTVISRGLGELEGFARLAGRLCAPGGTLAAMKAVYPYEELLQLPGTFKLRAVIPLLVPGASTAHQLVLLDPVQPA